MYTSSSESRDTLELCKCNQWQTMDRVQAWPISKSWGQA